MEMSFVIAAPELVQGVAQDLAGIRSSPPEAAVTAAGRTSGVAALAASVLRCASAPAFIKLTNSA
jgi:PE family